MSEFTALSTVVAFSEVRAWANTKGLSLGARGRVKRSVIVAFLADHPKHLRAVAAQVGVDVPKSTPKAGTVARLRLAEAVGAHVR